MGGAWEGRLLKMVCAREARVVTEWMRRTDAQSLPRAERL